MTLNELYKELNYVNHSREKRAYYATMVRNDPALFPLVLEILFLVDDSASNKAGWIAEFTCKQDIAMLYPHLDMFTHNMPMVYQDSALRPVAKICEYLILEYYKIKKPLARKSLKPHHKKRIVEAGFDWLITDQKVAVKAYTLTTLFWLGTETDWVHQELKKIMEQDYANQSAAYKARCKHTFKAIEIFNRQKMKII
ncbi:adenylosuccinate lyase [Dokdonia sinensis]|uniref:Adenylosuccinate lyase n=1 Tax=Dokdonia sinensis TaxID=2479847 RepID=A0A3M0G7E5_9FLAO|nr:adenylosuccinate lyase [Dokdonia sinensis]RMB60941.1 adenylosuccinate lyase [Dokdonia sinensis]